MARVAYGEPAARRVVRGQDRRRQYAPALLIEPAIEPAEDFAFVDDVHAAPEMRVHLGADGRHGRTVSGHISQTDSGHQAGAAHRQVVDIAPARARTRT